MPQDSPPIPVIQFFGVWPGSRSGHYRHDRNGRTIPGGDRVEGRKDGLYPWDYYSNRQPQAQGKVWHWHHPTEAMTLLLSWDRSADTRGGCCATFIVLGHVEAAHALEIAREAFPGVFARIELHLGRPVQLAGVI